MSKFSKKIDEVFLSFYLIVTVMVFLSYILRFGKGDYNFSEYFINYTSGFVRRGLTGEIILNFPKLSSGNIFHILLAIHLFFLLLNFFLMFKIAYKLGLSRAQQIILVLHPGLVGYYSWSYSNAFKKDILIQTFLLLVVYLFLTNYHKETIDRLLNYLIITLMCMPFIMLLHEITFFLMSILYLIIFKRILLILKIWYDLKNHFLCYFKFGTLIVLYLLNFIFFLILTRMHTSYDARATFDAVSKYMPLSYGPFPPISNNINFYYNPVLLKLKDTENLVTYVIGLLLVIFIYYFALSWNNKKTFAILFALNAHILLFSMIFSDWDRIIVFWSFTFFASYAIYFHDSGSMSQSFGFIKSLIHPMLNSRTLSWLPGLIIFLLVRVPTGNPAEIREISMIWLIIQNISERL